MRDGRCRAPDVRAPLGICAESGPPTPLRDTSCALGLYAPTTCGQDASCTTRLLASEMIAATIPRGPSGVLGVFTQGFINRLTGSQDTIDTSKAKLPKLLAELTALECLRGMLTGSMCRLV